MLMVGTQIEIARVPAFHLKLFFLPNIDLGFTIPVNHPALLQN